MSNNDSRILLLWLEGPLQAWGHNSKFGVRDTLNFPTRSGVLGLLCCARGAGGPEVEWLAQMATQTMEVRAYARADKLGGSCTAGSTIAGFSYGGQRLR
ncbi:MAG: type I-E CRISPR-associated protein Cas5/CasD [Shewanella fodinae]|nr:type I-E CRISPR-associated protein Cas5/CasD [Shewanella fodinae]